MAYRTLIRKVNILTVVLLCLFVWGETVFSQVSRFRLRTKTEVVPDPPSGDFFPVHSESSSSLGGWPTAGFDVQGTSSASVDVTITTGSVIWYRPIEAFIDPGTQVITDGGYAYVATTRGLVAFNAETGALAWRFDTELPVSTPTVDGGYVYLAGMDHNLYKINSTTGALVWTFDIATQGYSACPRVSNGRVFVGNRDGFMYAVNTTTGNEVWSYETGGPIMQTASGNVNVLYFASMDMYGYALDANNGNLVWKTSSVLPGETYSQWWPVVTDAYVLWSAANPYKTYPANPGAFNTDASNGADFNAFFNTAGGGTTATVGTVTTNSNGSHGWPVGSNVVDSVNGAGFYTLTGYLSTFPDRRVYALINRATGAEVLPGVPLFESSQNEQGQMSPPASDGTDFFFNAPYAGSAGGGIPRSRILEWEPGNQYLRRWGNIDFAIDEPILVTRTAGNVFINMAVDREARKITTSSSSAYWSYGGGQLQAVLPSANWPTDAEDVAATKTIASISLTNPATLTFTAAHGLITGNVINIKRVSGASSTPNLITTPYVVTVTGSDTVTIPVSVTAASGTFYLGDLCGSDAPNTSGGTCDTTGTDYDPMWACYDYALERLHCYYKGTLTGEASQYGLYGASQYGTHANRNGVYNEHGNQNPLSPHAWLNGSSTRVQRFFTIRSNTLIALGDSSTETALDPVLINPNPTHPAQSLSGAQIASKLEIEVQKMVDLWIANGNSGFLNPAYINDGSDGSVTTGFEDDLYFKVPADTLYTLSIAYPHLSSGLQTQLTSYLAAYWTLYFGGTPVRAIGFDAGTGREAMDYPSEVTTRFAAIGNTTSGSMKQRIFEAAYEYAANVPSVNGATVFSALKSLLIYTPSGLDLTRNPAAYHDYIVGYRGYINLQAECVADGGGSACTSSVVTAVSNVVSQLATLEAARTSGFEKDMPWESEFDNPAGISINQYTRRWNCARNFMHLTPELGETLAVSADSAEILQALDEAEYLCPLWLEARNDVSFQESSQHHIFDSHAVFLAKAYVRGESRPELSKWLDVSWFKYGDLYYMQNLVAALRAPDVGVSSIESNSTATQFARYEIDFKLSGSTATNLQMPYTASPPTGIPAGYGVSVDVQYSANSFSTTYTQPCFLYQDFDYQVKSSRDWLKPAEATSWKCRLAFPTAATWEWRIVTTDAGGTSTAPTHSVVVSSGADPGYVRVSATDTRFFETPDGVKFIPVGYNGQDQWDDPITDITSRLDRMGTAGANHMRLWLAPSSIYGSSWHPWYEPNGEYGGYIPTEGLENLDNNTFPLGMYERIAYNEASGVENSNTFNEACRLTNTAKSPVAVEPSTTYKIKVTYWNFNIVGPRTTSTHSNYGFVLKMQNPASGTWHTSGSTACWRPGSSNSTGQVISSYTHTTTGFETLEGTWTSGSSGVTSNIMPVFYLALENVCGRLSEGATCSTTAGASTASTYIKKVEMYKMDGGVEVGPNLMTKSDFERYNSTFDQKYSYVLDKIVESAEDNGVKLQLVVEEKDDLTLSRTSTGGAWTTQNVANFLAASGTPVRYLHEGWWRYLQARYGYSTAIIAWEALNEGSNASNHRAHANALGAAMHTNAVMSHLVSTSLATTLADSFWSSATNLDYYSVHAYPESTLISGEVAVGSAIDSAAVTFYSCTASQSCFETAMAHDGAWSQIETQQYRALFSFAKPCLRDETGPDVAGVAANPDIFDDQRGVWWHNQLWAQLGNGCFSLPFWTASPTGTMDGRQGPDSSTANGQHEIFTPFVTFISNIPLNNGNYVDAAATVSSSNVRATGQKDATNHRAHLWIQNRKHTWCAQVEADGGDVAACVPTWDDSALTGTVTVGGFANSTSYTVSYTTFDELGVPTVTSTTQASNGSGNMVIDLGPLADTVTDVAVKIGTYP